MLEQPIGQDRQTEENPFHQELFSSENMGNLSKGALNLGKDAVILGKDAVTLGKDALDLGKDSLKVVKDLAAAEGKGLNVVTNVLKSIAQQFEKYGDKLLMALKPQEKEELNDNIQKMGCPMAKLRAALSKSGGSAEASDSPKSV